MVEDFSIIHKIIIFPVLSAPGASQVRASFQALGRPNADVARGAAGMGHDGLRNGDHTTINTTYKHDDLYRGLWLFFTMFYPH